MKLQVQPIIIVDNTIYHIINPLIITNVNSILMIEQHYKLLIELVMIGESEKCGGIHSGIPPTDINQLPIIQFGDEQQYRNKTKLFLMLVP